MSVKIDILFLEPGDSYDPIGWGHLRGQTSSNFQLYYKADHYRIYQGRFEASTEAQLWAYFENNFGCMVRNGASATEGAPLGFSTERGPSGELFTWGNEIPYYEIRDALTGKLYKSGRLPRERYDCFTTHPKMEKPNEC